jgi:hypothetical protein
MMQRTRQDLVSSTPARRRWQVSLFGEADQPDLPELIEYEDSASAYIPEAFGYVIGRAIEELMKAGQT